LPTSTAPLTLAFLGSLRILLNERKVTLGQPKQRAVLALLASRPNDVVSTIEIIDAVWDWEVPRTASSAVHTYIAYLRRVLGQRQGGHSDRQFIESSGGGYVLHMEPGNIDIEAFTRHLSKAREFRSLGSAQAAIEEFNAAMGLWRGDAYTNIPGPFAAMERNRLHELHMTAVEEWASAMGTVGRDIEAIPVLSEAVTREPLRERLRWLLMLFFYRCGRRASALSLYQQTRQLLRDELGVDPSPMLQSLHHKILTDDPALRSRHPDETLSAAHVGGQPNPDSQPSLLPAGTRCFVGRAQEYSWLREALGRFGQDHETAPAITVIEGPAGVGKTTLAVQVAHSLSSDFPDGQIFIDLAGFSQSGGPLDAAHALRLILTGFGMSWAHMPPDLESLIAVYRRTLHGKRVFLLLDDAFDAGQVRPLIPPDPSVMLVTSRCLLTGLESRDGARRMKLRPLSSLESVELLAALVGRDRVHRQSRDAAVLAGICAHLPLALRVVAGNLIDNPMLPLSDVVRCYDSITVRLQRLDVAEDPAASVREVLAASYRALPSDAADLFRLLGTRQLSVINEDTVAALAGVSKDKALQLLSLLVRRNMLEPTAASFYKFAPLMDLYAANCAEREEEARRSRTVLAQ
jgi:DNA-binding SARP family transcriptional activator